MILVDEQGNVIQATVIKYQFNKFLNDLKEGGSYLIVSPTMGKQHRSFLLHSEQNKLNFIGSTILLKSKDFSGSTYGFSFVHYETILTNNFPRNCSIDVIGAVIPKDDPLKVQIVNGTRRLKIDIRNLEGEEIEVTLWFELVDQLASYIQQNPNKTPVVIVLRFGKKNELQGEPSVTSWFKWSKLFVNTDIDEINKFKERYKLSVVVRDEEGTIALTLFDRDTVGLVKISCKDLVEKTNRIGDTLSLFPELNIVKNRTFAMKVTVRNCNVEKQNQQYTISSLTDDEEIIAEFNTKLNAKVNFMV
ncbi:hypothetical protein LXL04_017306 [Taraxacum kok-saghyz]